MWEYINSILIFYRICGNSGGETFTKQNLGPTNMMIVRFYSDRYDTVSPENGFELSVTAAPSGTLLNLINACRKKNWNVNVEENVLLFIVFCGQLWYNMYVQEGLTIKNKDYLVIKYRLNFITSTSKQNKYKIQKQKS